MFISGGSLTYSINVYKYAFIFMNTYIHKYFYIHWMSNALCLGNVPKFHSLIKLPREWTVFLFRSRGNEQFSLSFPQEHREHLSFPGNTSRERNFGWTFPNKIQALRLVVEVLSSTGGGGVKTTWSTKRLRRRRWTMVAWGQAFHLLDTHSRGERSVSGRGRSCMRKTEGG